MNEKDIQEILDYIKKNYNENGLTDWFTITHKYNENLIMELMDRGIIYEPIFGFIRVV